MPNSSKVCDPLNDTATYVARDAFKGNYAAADTRWFCYEDYATLNKKVGGLNINYI
jgi:hypothetical protein